MRNTAVSWPKRDLNKDPKERKRGAMGKAYLCNCRVDSFYRCEFSAIDNYYYFNIVLCAVSLL
jgi:hypothetical protein